MSLTQRIRNTMRNREFRFKLNDVVKFDQGYYEIDTAENINSKLRKRSPKLRE